MAYLLPCECGKKTPISPAQAGDRIPCECGAVLEAPTLREMRQLETDEAATDRQATAATAWSVRHGALTAGLMLAALLAGVGLWFKATDPPPPEGFNTTRSMAVMETGLERMTPTEGYQRWVNLYQPMRRFDQLQDPREAALRVELTKRRLIRYAFFGAAAAAALIGAVLYVALPQPRGDSQTQAAG